MQGRSGGFIDGTTFATTWMPQQPEIFASLTEAGRNIWNHTAEAFSDVYRSVSTLVGVRQHLLNSGYATDPNAVYYASSFDAILDARGVMQSYIMAHPAMEVLYNKGVDVYEEWTPNTCSRVMYARVIEEFVQFSEDGTESVMYEWDEGYDDIPELSDDDKLAIHNTYLYMEKHILKDVESLLLGQLTE